MIPVLFSVSFCRTGSDANVDQLYRWTEAQVLCPVSVQSGQVFKFLRESIPLSETPLPHLRDRNQLPPLSVSDIWCTLDPGGGGRTGGWISREVLTRSAPMPRQAAARRRRRRPLHQRTNLLLCDWDCKSCAELSIFSLLPGGLI